MKKRPFRLKYNLYRLQQHLAITTSEAKALWVVLVFFIAGLVISEFKKRRPVISSNFYAETDSLFLQATAALKAREEASQADSLYTTMDTSKIKQHDDLVAFFTPAFPININTASYSDLERLPRIGPKMAERIVDFRNKNGKFRRKSDLLKVKGIGEKTFEQLKDKISTQ
ncbi:MAG: ComEA family DNA-binding protein [Rhodothermales bacterium]